MAEHEHDEHEMISTRIKAAPAIAKPCGVWLGTPRPAPATEPGGVKFIDATIDDGVLSPGLDDVGPQVTQHGYDAKSIANQFETNPGEVVRLFRGALDAGRALTLVDKMRAAGPPD